MATVKDNVLEILENNKGNAISGEEIANRLGVSRNSVWKAVNSLKSEGYKIDAVTNLGYTLSADSDILSATAISKYLKVDCNVEVFNSLNSTNDWLKDIAQKGEKEGKVIVAKTQTCGKGRLGRSFYSPDNSGVYFSVLLRPTIHADKAVLITTCAAVAVAESIDAVAGNPTEIKWVNDIFLNGKKVCGILNEATFDLETYGLQYVVLGIGINVTSPKNGFPNDINNIAGSIFENNDILPDTKSRLIANVLNRFFYYYKNIENKEFITVYRDKFYLKNKPIYVLRGNERKTAIAREITDDFGLLVEYNDGTKEVLNSGEVSIRGAK